MIHKIGRGPCTIYEISVRYTAVHGQTSAQSRGSIGASTAKSWARHMLSPHETHGLQDLEEALPGCAQHGHWDIEEQNVHV